MKTLAAICILMMTTASWAGLEKTAIEKNLPSILKGVSSVEVLELERDTQIEILTGVQTLGMSAFDGIKDYEATLRLTMNNRQELDFDCDIMHHFRESKRAVEMAHCTPVGHHVEFYTLIKVTGRVSTFSDH